MFARQKAHVEGRHQARRHPCYRPLVPSVAFDPLGRESFCYRDSKGAGAEVARLAAVNVALVMRADEAYVLTRQSTNKVCKRRTNARRCKQNGRILTDWRAGGTSFS
jgi:hypothetical protein